MVVECDKVSERQRMTLYLKPRDLDESWGSLERENKVVGLFLAERFFVKSVSHSLCEDWLETGMQIWRGSFGKLLLGGEARERYFVFELLSSRRGSNPGRGVPRYVMIHLFFLLSAPCPSLSWRVTRF
jgi:hypothetical protein